MGDYEPVPRLRLVDHKDNFRVPEQVEKPTPTPEEIEENKRKWGYAD